MSALRRLLMESSDSEDEREPKRPKIYQIRINFEVISDFEFKEKFRLRRSEFQFLLEKIGNQLPIRMIHHKYFPYIIMI